jgi:RNA polymerase sigma-70 factor (ECF subfamily)
MGAARVGSSLDKGSFARVEAVYRAEGKRMWRAVFLYAHDSSVADEAVAEAFAQVLRRGDAVRSVDKWVWSTAFRVARGMLAARSQLPLAGPAVEGATPAAAEAIEMRELVARLPETQRSCVVLYYFADRPVSEVASILGTSSSAVGVHLYRGRKALRTMMGEDTDVEP